MTDFYFVFGNFFRSVLMVKKKKRLEADHFSRANAKHKPKGSHTSVAAGGKLAG